MRNSMSIQNAVLAVGALVIIACSDSSPTPAATTGGSTASGGAAGTGGGAGGATGGSTGGSTGGATPMDGGDIKVSLITKEAGNPFFAKMIEGAQAEATVKGATVTATTATTNAEQVTAITAALAGGTKGILIVAADTAAIVPTITEAKKTALVIALDTPTDPENATDALFATDNKAAGKLIGQYAKAALAAKADAGTAKIVTLDGPVGLTVSDLRHAGFTEGFGIPDGGPSIVCQKPTMGSDTTGQAAMDACLAMSKDINVIYTVNEPVAAGAYASLVAGGVDPRGVIIVSVDGGCPGVQAVKAGRIAATSQQYPLKMASLGVDAVVTFVQSGTRASGYTDTGVNLIADVAQTGVTSKDTVYGLANCWGTVVDGGIF
jgi:fructose transport system substrate-binding protein